MSKPKLILKTIRGAIDVLESRYELSEKFIFEKTNHHLRPYNQPKYSLVKACLF